MSMSQGALKLADQLWVGEAATSATVKTTEAGANSTALAAQGSGISMDTKTAAAIVAKGLALVQGIIAKTIAEIGLAVPFLATPGFAGALVAMSTAASTGLSESLAVVAMTRAELLAPTTAMTVNGAPVAVTGAPAGVAGQSPFALASAVLDTISPVVGTAMELSSSLMQPISKMLNVDASASDPVITGACLLYTSPSPRDKRQSRMPSSA